MSRRQQGQPGSSSGDGGRAVSQASLAVDRALRDFVNRQPVADFYDLVRYHFGWLGHGSVPALAQPELHLAPALCLLACEACGGRPEDALPLAEGIALLEKFLKLEDDMEHSRRERGGRPAVWSLWGIPQAMNAADGLHALAKMALLEARGRVPTERILHLEGELDTCCLALCEAIHREFTAIDCAGSTDGRLALMFGCAAYGGAYAFGSGAECCARLRAFGERLGAMLEASTSSPSRSENYEQALEALNQLELPVRKLHALRDVAAFLLDVPTP
ncbi:MAG TPA: polyprenyl synthetase family protein [Chloroflexota bacterium]|nr:polyprenyl synthetase family protein [Chloroflexota bacterium]